MKKHFAVGLCVCLMLCSFPLAAQNRWSIEFRPGAAIPIGELGDAKLKVGLELEPTIAFRFLPYTSVYAGWGWVRFGTDDSFRNGVVNFEETGYRLGLQFMYPAGDTRFSYLVRAGGIYNHIETEDGDSIIESTSHGFGVQGELGIGVNITENFLLTPGARFRWLPREMNIDGTSTDVDLRYVSAGVGVVWSFGK